MKKKGVEKFANSWNELVKVLIELEKCWKVTKKIREKYEISINDLPDNCQKVMTRVNLKSRFTVGIVRFVEFIERYGTFEDCFIKIKKNKKEEVENGR